ncbi:MAG: threonine-phosphate decarboxylase CobD [Magnetospiraceae bacterium]
MRDGITTPVSDLPPHGGDTAQAALRFGVAPEDFLDLSTGVNPWPYPMEPTDYREAERLPDSRLLARLLESAGRYFGIQDLASIVPAAGSQAVIQQLPQLLRPQSVAIVSPTYSEHEAAWRRAGVTVTPARNPDASADVVVVVNPNNPDGRQWPADALQDIATRQARKGGFLIVDGAFADVATDQVLPQAGVPGLIVLRSFGKFFGLPGLRLGFALLPAALAADLKDRLGPWPVNGPAARIAARAMADDAWIVASRSRIREHAVRLDALIARFGGTIIGGTDLFRTATFSDARMVWDCLGRLGVLCRAFDYDQHLLRFGLPGTETAFQILAEGLETVIKSRPGA